MNQYVCVYCERSFKAHKVRKYCSQECCRKKGLVTLNCTHCGVEFTKRKVVLEYSRDVQENKNFFCTTKCCGAYYRANGRPNPNKGKTYKKNPSIYRLLICDNCGELYSVRKKSYIPSKKSCSKQCKGQLTKAALRRREVNG